jgi:hypothetical protein
MMREGNSMDYGVVDGDGNVDTNVEKGENDQNAQLRSCSSFLRAQQPEHPDGEERST